MEEAKEEAKRGRKTKKKQQQQLQYEAVVGPREFTRAATLHAVAKHIATDNQVGRQPLSCSKKLTLTHL